MAITTVTTIAITTAIMTDARCNFLTPVDGNVRWREFHEFSWIQSRRLGGSWFCLTKRKSQRIISCKKLVLARESKRRRTSGF